MSNFRRKVLYDSTLTNAQQVDANNAAHVHILDASGNPYFTAANPAHVQATDLDIRDLSSTQDSVEVIGVKPDGTNTQPSMDAVARAGYQIITDGTEVLLVNADGSTNSVVTATDLDIRDLTSVSDSVEVVGVKPDGTNTQPSMDVVGRAGFQKITDGTETASVTVDNALLVCDTSNGLAISRGLVTGVATEQKFGFTPDFDTTDGEVTIWDGADDGGINQMVYQYSSTADIDSLSSSSGSDTGDIKVYGLDTSGNLSEQTITLTGQTRVALSTSLQSVYRMENVGSSDFVGKVYCYVNSSITAGVPDDPTKVRAVVDDGNNQTEMAVYRVPTGKKAYIRSIDASPGSGTKTTNYIIRLKVRPSGGVFQLKKRFVVNDESGPFEYTYEDPAGPFSALSDIEMTCEITAGGVIGASAAAGFDFVLVDD